LRLLPDPQRQSDIKFLFGNRLSYVSRMWLIFGFFITGLTVEIFFHFYIGLAIISVGTILSLIKGFRETSEPSGPESWGQVTPDEYQKVKDRQKQIKQWDLDCFDISNPLGFWTFIGFAIVSFVIWHAVPLNLGILIVCNIVVILGPHWITGMRGYFLKDKLVIKIDFLRKIFEALAEPSDIQVLPMLGVKERKETGEKAPFDARLMVRYINAPECFMGMQVQISLNDVQGKYHPYLYCVLIAKKGAGFFDHSHDILAQLPGNMVHSFENNDEVDVLVIRQRTTSTAGYHTNLKTAKVIVISTLEVLRKL